MRMERKGLLRWITAIALGCTGVLCATAHAAPVVRYTTDQRGDFALIGNTMGFDCRSQIPSPVVGTVNRAACGSKVDDTSIDVLWKTDMGTATASLSTTYQDASSIAVLSIPSGSSITYARLYWAAGRKSTDAEGTQVTFAREGAFSQSVTADSFNTIRGAASSPGMVYQATADVTTLVKQYGVGAYKVIGIPAMNPANQDIEVNFNAWSLVVFYENSTGPTRNLTIFDGLDEVRDKRPAEVTLNGFLVPNAGFDAKLGVIAYEGDETLSGDELYFNNYAKPLSDGSDPVLLPGVDCLLLGSGNNCHNFFNASRTWMNNVVSVAGDLPQMTGGPGSMNGFDLDVINVTSLLSPGDKTAKIKASSTQDVYYLGAFITSISTLSPVFKDTVKSYTNLTSTDGKNRRGDTIQYSIGKIVNTGSDAAVETKLVDELPNFVTYKPGTLCIVEGASCTPLTDAVGDDRGEFDPLSRTITVRLGENANALFGGKVKVDQAPLEVRFQVVVASNAYGLVANQGQLSFKGESSLSLNLPVSIELSGNGITPKAPTVFEVFICDTNADCKNPNAPLCITSAEPHYCTNQCNTDADCKAIGSSYVCREQDTRKVCVPTVDLALTATSTSVNIDNQLTYSLVVQNVGQLAVPGATVTYQVPSDIQVQSVNGNDGWTCSVQNNQVVCTSTATSIAATETLPTISISIIAPLGMASAHLHAVVEAKGILEIELGNNTVDRDDGLLKVGLSGGGFGCTLSASQNQPSLLELSAWIAAFALCVGFLYWKTVRLRKQNQSAEK